MPLILYRSEAEPLPERVGLEGKEGVGGLWHIEYLSLPPMPREKGKWTVTKCYGSELKRAQKIEESFDVALPLAKYPFETDLTIGRWDGTQWTHQGIHISEQKDGSMFFKTEKLGAFRFFVGTYSELEIVTGPR